ncbi:hypothetical protein PSm6_59780 [Pseudomonas solani]|uniref:Uncharacterized protein n=1 Tax=Pseudomonas solani TaxID=2731552 RepID=A0ABM7LJ08_9PSED|nr:hypothetical protein PSm6_59780 [Pseudomonas solani]
MNEEVRAFLGGDEAEAFFIVEPFDGAGLTSGHDVSPGKCNGIDAGTSGSRLRAKAKEAEEMKD